MGLEATGKPDRYKVWLRDNDEWTLERAKVEGGEKDLQGLGEEAAQ
ncbi:MULTISPECIES: hypothetical protein [Halorubrum]|nr:hypothetical protein [Halorubrum persicum]